MKRTHHACAACANERVTDQQAKLDFLIRVVGTSTAELNNASSLFGRSLDGRLRARYFYARLKGKLA